MGMRDRSNRSANRTNEALAARERKLVSDQSFDWESIANQLGSPEKYQQLMDAVQEATDDNESLAKLFTRLESLGTEGLALAEKVRGLIPI